MKLNKPNEFQTALEIYKTETIIGEGGSGRVFLVRDTKENKYAIKCLFPEMVLTDRLGRFKNELNFSLKNTHPNILSVLDHGFILIENKKSPFYVMQYYPSTLRKLITNGIEPNFAYGLFLKMLDGISEAHQREIWHRDLKPENILANPTSLELVIADFGIAHFSEDELYTAVQTRLDERLANFQYAAPEQRIKGQKVDQRADIYALGLILNEMFTGVVPLGTDYKRVSDISQPFAFLDNVIEQMIRQAPNRRPSSIIDIKVEMESAQQSQFESRLNTRRNINMVSPQMTYRAEVDCVGRIDNSTCNTVLSISAGLSYSIMVTSQEKLKALNIISEIHPQWKKTRCRVFLYSLLIYILIKDNMKKLDVVIIDPEYKGYEPQIKELIFRLLRKSNLNIRNDQIVFSRIDRGSPARLMASRVFKENADPDFILSAKQILEVIK